MRTTAAIAMIMFCVSAPAADSQSGEYFNEEGYRSDNYRSDLPTTLEGGKVLTLEQVRAAMDNDGAVVVDVLSAGDVEPDPFDGSWEIEEIHQNIPGSTWLPNVGRGYLEESMSSYFQEQLTALTDGDKGQHLIFYCVEDCWMAWNASKRALSLGYRNVSWFPRGVTAWEEAGYATELVKPVPVAVD